MIIEYQRPKTLDEALELLARSDPPSYPLGGGARLSRPSEEKYAVVDLQALGLNKIEPRGNMLAVGATVTLRQLEMTADLPPALVEATRRETNIHLRQTGTVAGALASATGKSTLATALLALDARLVWQPGSEETGLGEYLPLRGSQKRGKLITEIVIPLNVKLEIESVARTPGDLAIICAAAARWPSGRTRLAVGGLGTGPVLALDGLDGRGMEEAGYNAYSHYPNLKPELQEYIQETARILARRLAAALNSPE